MVKLINLNGLKWIGELPIFLNYYRSIIHVILIGTILNLNDLNCITGTFGLGHGKYPQKPGGPRN